MEPASPSTRNQHERTAADTLLSLSAVRNDLHANSRRPRIPFKRYRQGDQLGSSRPLERYGAPVFHGHRTGAFYRPNHSYNYSHPSFARDFRMMDRRPAFPMAYPYPPRVPTQPPRPMEVRSSRISLNSEPANRTFYTPRVSPRAAPVSPTSIDVEIREEVENSPTPSQSQRRMTEIAKVVLPSTLLLPKSLTARSRSPSPPDTEINPLMAIQKTDKPPDGRGIIPSPVDVLIGTGRACSSHPGNRRFHKAIFDCCEEYFSADYKKGVVDRAIAVVHGSGGRFLTKGKHSKWVEVVDMDRLERNTRKSFHMARRQKQREAPGGADRVCRRGKWRQSRSSSEQLSYTQKFNVGEQVAIFRENLGAYFIGKIEAQENGLSLLQYENARLRTEWIDLHQVDCRKVS